MTDNMPRICDYEGSSYRTDFWEGRGRDYEDQVERQVLARLLPASGQRLLEIGAGFGRLTQEYTQFKQVVLLDYSFSQLQYARQRLGDDGYIYVAANAYQLPFAPGNFDAATMVRTIHHFEDVPAVLAQVHSVLTQGSTFILEYANKRNLKALLRHRLGQQKWDPNSYTPVEFVEMNYNFHPAYMDEHLRATGFTQRQCLPASFLRLAWLKKTLPTSALVSIDNLLQRTGWLVTPSVFTQNVIEGTAPQVPNDLVFASPLTGAPLQQEGDAMVAPDGTRWAIRDGIYDFKAPL